MTPGARERCTRALERVKNEQRLAKSLAKAAEMAFEEARTRLHERNARLYAVTHQVSRLEDQLKNDVRDETG